jgi:type II secretory pathway component PulL
MPQRILALDIEDAEVKAALLETTFRDYRIAGLFHAPLTVDGGAIPDQVRRFLERHQLVGDTVVSTLPGKLVSHRVFFLPFRDRKRLNQTVPFELEAQVPFGLDDVIVDYQVIHRDRSGTTVLAALVQKEDLEAHLAALKSAGIDPKVVDFAPLSSLNALRVLAKDLPGTFAFIDFGASTADVLLYRNQALVGLRTVSLSRGVAATNGTGGADNGQGLAAAEGVTSGAHGDAVAAALAVELRWTLMVINGAPLDEQLPCYVAGAPAWLDTIAPALERDVGLAVRRLDVLVLRSVPPETRAALPSCTAPLGVALREVAPGNTVGLNFRRGEFTYHRGQQEVRRALGRAGVLAGVLFVLAVANMFVSYQLQLARLGAIDSQIQKVFQATLPDERAVDEKVQLQAEIDKTLQKLQLLGGIVSLSGVAAIDVMRGISASLPDRVKIDVEEYSFDPDAVRIRGRTDSFELVDTVKQHLVTLPYFTEVQVKDVKSAPDGNGVTFRLILVITQDSGLGE